MTTESAISLNIDRKIMRTRIVMMMVVLMFLGVL